MSYCTVYICVRNEGQSQRFRSARTVKKDVDTYNRAVILRIEMYSRKLSLTVARIISLCVVARYFDRFSYLSRDAQLMRNTPTDSVQSRSEDSRLNSFQKNLVWKNKI